MNIKIVSSVVLALGIVILVVLVVLGSVVRQTIRDTITDRLVYELGEGAKKSPMEENCYRNTKPTIENEYYLWNLTNQQEFLAGEKPHFNLTGPFTYVRQYCRYDYELNTAQGYLAYRTRNEGYVFLRVNSSDDDTVRITNINPAYLGVLGTVDGDDSLLPLPISSILLKATILTLQLPSTITAVQQQAVPANLLANTQTAIQNTNNQNVAALVEEFTVTDFFETTTAAVDDVQGWANYMAALNPSVDATIDAPTQQSLFDTFTDATTFASFLTLTGAEIQVDPRFTLSAGLGEYLASFAAYLYDATLDARDATGTVYNQWATGSGSTFAPAGWALPSGSGISPADAAKLLDANDPCPLTSDAGMQQWFRVLGGASLESVCPGNFTLSAPQVEAITAWLTSYTNTVVGPALLTRYGLASWDDFAYAQWATRVAGKSVQDMFSFNPVTLAATLSSLTGLPTLAIASQIMTNNRLNFAPEPNLGITQSFDTPMAKDVLNGTYSIFNVTNLVRLATLIVARDFNSVTAFYGSSFSRAVAPFFLRDYLQAAFVPGFSVPMLRLAYGLGGGYVTTRTAREWLFTARDPLLPLLGQGNAVNFVQNLTQTREQSDALPKFHIRVYTGKNDLYWALMPYNNGTNLTFWNGTVEITGFNGTQVLPNYYIDDIPADKPLVLFHPLINRTIPFTNRGKDTWNGVNVRYLSVSDDALLASNLNPDNYKYYSKYSGAINKTSNPPELPIFLTTPNFLSAEPAFSENVTWTDTKFMPYDDSARTRHRLKQFILVEPLLGSTLWGNLPIQVNFEYKPSTNFPVNGGFAPIYWNSIGDKATDDDLETIKNSLYSGQRAWKALIGVGAGVGSIMIIAGIVGLVYYRKQKGIKL